jgi:hypothetical protein
MICPANPPLVINSIIDKVFSTGTASAKFSWQQIKYLLVTIGSYNFSLLLKR